MTSKQIAETLRLHAAWLQGEAGGARADLRSANLSYAGMYQADLRYAWLSNANLCGSDLTGVGFCGADLCYANLRHADLTGADLDGANLTGANLAQSRGVRFADCAWSDHGISARRLLCVEINGNLRLWCGCFSGTPDELRAWIAGDHPKYAASRLKALDFVLSCMEAQ